MIKSASSYCDMEGDLESWPLVDLWLWLSRAGRSAGIRVESAGANGWIFMRRGQIASCDARGRLGAPALGTLLQQRQGTFRVSSQLAKLGRPNIFETTEKLLLELSIARDERVRMVA